MNLQPSYISNSEYRDIKRFLTKFLCFALLVFSVDKVFAYWTTQAMLNDSARFVSIVYRGELDSQIVFFGSSKTYVNIDAATVEEKTGISCYNLAIGNASIEMCEFFLEEFLINNTKPNIVFMEADFAHLRNGTLNFRTELLAPFSNVSSHTARRLNPTPAEQLVFWFLRCKNYSSGEGVTALGRSMVKYARNILEGKVLHETTPQSASAAGYQDNHQFKDTHGSHLLAPLSAEKLKEDWRNDRGGKTIAPQIVPERKEIYKHIVELTKSQGITLILYGPPFLGSKMDKDYAQEVDEFFTELAEQHEHVHYWSFREDTMLRSDVAFWTDPIHMNWNGAEILSQKIAEKLNTLRGEWEGVIKF